MHELSLATWFIHLATLLEWTLAILVINKISTSSNNKSINWLAIAMLPNLSSAMTAITWHIFDNTEELKGLVVIQAGLTVIGNTAMAIAAYNLSKNEAVNIT